MDMLARAAANANAVKIAQQASRVANAAARAEAAACEDAFTVAERACDDIVGVARAQFNPPSSDVRLKSRSGEVSPVWLYFEKLPLLIDPDTGKDVQKVKCICVRTLADGTKRGCGTELIYKSSDGTKNLIR